MSNENRTYVIDTNIVVDYTDIIPNGAEFQPEEPTIDLSGAHIVIPTAVVRELSSFKKESTDRGRAARIALRRIRKLVENSGRTMDETYKLKNPLVIHNGAQRFSIFPIENDFSKTMQFRPSADDMDGQIILTALAAKERVDGEVILLTNDNGLAIRAAVRGLKSSRYGYKYPTPYSGRRDVVVPKDLYLKFLCDKQIPLEDWVQAMPKEPPLIANEFLIMKPSEPVNIDSTEERVFFVNVGRYDKDAEAIVALRYIRQYPGQLKNPGQAIYAEALMDPDIALVICTGPAGSGKTYMAAIYGYTACKNGDYIGVTVVPCRVEDDGVGFLPGDLDEKLDPNVQPIKNALRNYLMHEDRDIKRQMEKIRKYGTDSKDEDQKPDQKPEQKSVKARLSDKVNLIWNNWFDNIPIAYARGRDFSSELAIYDEFQDQNRTQADTLLKRLGEAGKIIITGDIEQIHAAYLDRENNGLIYARRQVMDSPMVAQVTFTEDEVVRHPLVRMIAQRQKETRTKSPTSE